MGLLTRVTQQYKFLGATVRSMQMSGGNGGTPITLTVVLVEDLEAGDAIDVPPVWTPVTFTLEGFRFRGLVRNRSTQYDLQGRPVHRVMVSDPRDLLDGVQVVLDRWRGPVSGVPNVLNAYGWHESRYGFGGALTNEAGMYWQTREASLGLSKSDGITLGLGDFVGIKPAVEALTREPGDFGGPIVFAGHSYAVDLGGLPTAPDSFRMGGGLARPLLDLVEDLCQTAGADYQLTLGDDDVIRFKCSYRNTAPASGAIAAWAASQANAQSIVVGVELANDYTNAVLLGGAVQRLNLVSNGDGGTAIWPFWGVDADGLAVWGKGDPEAGPHTFTLPCPDVADVVGDVVYPCSIAELRAAAVDLDSWSAYLLCREPDKADVLSLVGQVDSAGLEDLFGDAVLRRDLIATDVDTADAFGAMNADDYWSSRIQRLYDFVSGYARDYMGTRFLVRLPVWIYRKLVPETTEVVASEEASDGGYLEEGSSPLGLPYAEIDRFLTDDGRFGCFVAFPLDDAMDLGSLDPRTAVAANGMVYVRATAGRDFYYPNGPLPYVAVTLDQPIYKAATDPLGGIDDVADMLNMTPEQVASAAGMRHGSFPVRIQPPCYRPSAAAVPTRSNVQSYGPWTSGSGVPGRTFFDQDEDLTPWAYGGTAAMNIAARDRVATITTDRQAVETAQVKLIDTPSAQIGDALVAGGPNVTGISVDLSTDEISTTYTCQTYTPVFGAFGRQNAERIRRLGVAGQQVRRNVRSLYGMGRQVEAARGRAALGMMANASHAVAQRSPHECVMATVVKNPVDGGFRTQVSTMAVDELMANVRADDEEVYRRTAGMGLEGLLRPFSTDHHPEDAPPIDDGDGGTIEPEPSLPHYEDPDAKITAGRKPITRDLDPFDSPDVDVLVTGDSYNAGLHRKKGDPAYDKARPVGLRGPVAVAGWGLDVTGKPVPNAGDESLDLQDWSDDWLDDHKEHPEKWKAGVLGVSWCKWTKTWRPPTSLFGKAKAAIPSGSSGPMIVDLGELDYGTDEVDVLNRFGADVAADAYMCVTYNPLSGRYIITSATCKTS